MTMFKNFMVLLLFANYCLSINLKSYSLNLAHSFEKNNILENEEKGNDGNTYEDYNEIQEYNEYTNNNIFGMKKRYDNLMDCYEHYDLIDNGQHVLPKYTAQIKCLEGKRPPLELRSCESKTVDQILLEKENGIYKEKIIQIDGGCHKLND